MKASRAWLCTLFALLALGARTVSATETNEPPTSDTEDSQPVDEGEGILPAGVAVSTTPLTPVSPYTERRPYDQAREELAEAQRLQAKGANEAASDTALAAYEDLLLVRTRRLGKKARQKVRAERRQAAVLYIDTGIAYINEWYKARGTEDARKEAVGRFEDLRDVARDYEGLSHRLNEAIRKLSAG